MKLQLLICIFCFALFYSYGQVGIGTTSPEAGLDISNPINGLLIPRVSLINLTIEAPIINPAGGSIPISTLIFHDGTNGINSGFYYWNGTKWTLLTTEESTQWSLLGNSGTNPGINFIGTSDTEDLVFKTHNIERARILAGGNIGIGTNSPIAKTHIFQEDPQDGILLIHSGSIGNLCLQTLQIVTQQFQLKIAQLELV